MVSGSDPNTSIIPPSKSIDGATEVRENLERERWVAARCLHDVRAKGLTDNVAWPLYHTLDSQAHGDFRNRTGSSTTPKSLACFPDVGDCSDLKPKPAAQIARQRAASPSPLPPLGCAARRSFPAG